MRPTLLRFRPEGLFWMLVLVAALSSACSSETGDDAGGASGDGGKKSVYVVNYPLAYFAERISDGLFDVEFPVPSDVDPAFWKPTDEEVAAFQGADLILRNGAMYAKWAGRVTLPATKVVDASSKIRDYFIETEGVTHTHGPDGEAHSHAGIDFNLWVDPNFARSQAQRVMEGMLKLAPSSATDLSDRYDALAQDLRSLDRELDALESKTKGVPLVASHPVYNYAAQRYGWNLENLHWEPTQMPTDEQWAELAKLLEKHPAKLMIWEGEPDPAIAKRLLDETGMKGVVFDPCGNRPDSGDYLSVMRANIAALGKALDG